MKQNRNLNLKLRLITLITMSLFVLSALLYFTIQHAVKDMIEDLDNRLNSIAFTIDSEVMDAKHLFYGLAAALSQESITLNNERIKKLINNFDPKLRQNRSIPLESIIILDNKNKGVSSTLTQEFQARLELNGFPQCSERSSQQSFFSLLTLPIRPGVFGQNLLIPLSMRISDIKNQHIGTICSGLIVSELTDKLDLRFLPSNYFEPMKLQNKAPDYYQHEQHSLDDLSEYININTILKHYLKQDKITIHRALVTFSFFIEVTLKPAYLDRALNDISMFFICSLFTLIIFTYLIWITISGYFQAPLFLIYEKLNIVNKSIEEENLQFIMPLYLTNKFSLKHFSNDINKLIDNYYALKKEILKNPDKEMKKKILNLSLTEQHFLALNTGNITSEEKLYLNKLITMIDEESTILSLSDFLNQVADYCCEFYHELKIKIIIQKKDCKNFILKQAALIETIFHIFTFINRGSFDTDNNELILKGSFIDKNIFPTIAITISMPIETLPSLGWQSGPTYVYTSLLSIHLLAKENNLFFNIVKEDDKMIFILEPIDIISGDTLLDHGRNDSYRR